MEKRDFVRGEYFVFEGKTTIWDTEDVFIRVDCSVNALDKEQEHLSKYIDSINEKLIWIADHRSDIGNVLFDRVMMSKIDRPTDGSPLQPAVSRQDFCNSLKVDEIILAFDGDTADAELYLSSDSDYLDGRSITTVLSEHNEVACYLEE